MKEENKKKEQGGQKLIKITREQVIKKSDIYFILITIMLVSYLAFFFLLMGGFSEFAPSVGGNKPAAAMRAGVRIVAFGGIIIASAVFYLIANEVRAEEKKLQTKPSIYKIAGKKFWRWLWSDIKRSKK